MKAMAISPKDIVPLLKEQLGRLLKCSILPAHTYLAGGTAVYLYLGNRVSVDLDFFTQSYFLERIVTRETWGGTNGKK